MSQATGLSPEARAVVSALLPPEPASVEEERRRRQASLAVSCRLFARLGFDSGVAGHVSARDPGNPERFWVNPVARPFSRVRVSDLVLVDAAGQVVSGTGRVNLAAFAIHSAIHRARPDVVSAVHTHSRHGRAWSALGRLVEPISQDACAFYGDHAVYDHYSGPVLDVAEGEAIAAALGSRKALILQNHGLLTVGRTVEEAAWWFMALDEVCEAHLLLGPFGDALTIPDEHASVTATQVGSPEIGHLSFMPYFEEISNDEPEVLT